jgi:hypothetical protein
MTGNMAGDRPLTVIFSFLSRADATPLAFRRRGEGHILDATGNVLPDPAANPAANAFEADSNINFEKWSEYWRKVHGVRFVHMEDTDDRSFERLLRYDQLHRFPAGPTSLTPPPYIAPVDENGRLFPTIIGHVPPYRRPRWDGVAYLNFATLEDIAQVLGSERVRSKILPEDRAMFRDIAPILSRQFIIIPNAAGTDTVSLIKTHVRRAGLDRAEFQREWLHHHADLVPAQPATRDLVTRYVQLHNIGPEAEGAPFFHPETSEIDGVTLMGFANVGDAEIYLQTDDYRTIMEDERKIANEDLGEYWTSINFVIVNQIAQESTSSRKSDDR